jgi:hypothetical protein
MFRPRLTYDSAFFEAISEGDRERVERILQLEYSSNE